MIKFQSKIIGSRQVGNASFLDVFKFIITFGKKGRLYIVEPIKLKQWQALLDSRVNCRCTVPKSDLVISSDRQCKNCDNAFQWQGLNLWVCRNNIKKKLNVDCVSFTPILKTKGIVDLDLKT